MVSTLDVEALLLLVVAVAYVADEDREPPHPQERHLPLLRRPPPLEKPLDPHAATRDLTSGSEEQNPTGGGGWIVASTRGGDTGGGRFFDTSAAVVVGGEGGLGREAGARRAGDPRRRRRRALHPLPRPTIPAAVGASHGDPRAGARRAPAGAPHHQALESRGGSVRWGKGEWIIRWRDEDRERGRRSRLRQRGLRERGSHSGEPGRRYGVESVGIPSVGEGADAAAGWAGSRRRCAEL
jgi:hypothetical protein